MQRVELKTAYHWICEECCEDNFALPQKAELTDEAREDAFRQINDLQEWDELPEGWQCFDLVCIPNIVTCKKCGEKFTTVDERFVTEEDDPCES